MEPMLIVAGLLAGWIAEAVSRADGYGFHSDLGLGLAGSVVVGWIVWSLAATRGGMPGMLVIGACGGALAIVAQRRLWRSGRPGT